MKISNSNGQVKELLEFCKLLPSIRAMKSQLDVLQAERLIKEFGFENTKKQLEKMDNWVGIEKKNKSVYLTCKKWFELDMQKNGGIRKYDDPNSQVKKMENDTQKQKLAEFIKKYPVGTKLKNSEGKTGVVIDNGWIEFGDGLLPPNQAISLTWEIYNE